ncbi:MULTISPECIES: TrbI/VirB10 family protein [unclassified Mesorhizobium]|uniref:TrbI/VirB10 family protein n=1 Tax=unclassified Mesorhizobium TaxID=325217 RepID=UPI000F7552F8|nr:MULTISPECIES: TrbI/VirB10 family protein [unclassified Mesorhizobium]RUT89382.1 TrbI/VirB10 family protein [Mesorhizobium sp. M7A.T.Ca.US.000.02.1.1]RUT94808.1 TrbI/VirB10 family protein [Mesorhizobium sp. M7A.T.Ca.US.000.02.2.1]RUU67004.1 TrbI/VirB10 family protein [Mesorhizobium sp. M7A.T.Ca.TU.009.01.1.1]RUV21460.1 TrbI/VirB10 family protein [Mesorhizobium sp. M7A.F.Ca.MR.245.00.0.0]RUV37188.1 TrbI/VirB10 family protein [Mesorhizobium sp. M7A.F.Ca.MR.148.00.0.0]RUV52577.1 TrbI/VirB10 fa
MIENSRSGIPPKLDPEELQLRASPRRVVRFRRGVIIAIAALGSGAVFGVTMIALQGPALRIRDQAEDLYNTERKPTAEGLDTLPHDYSGMKPKPPVLGLPLPGDLGRPILERQRQLGIVPGQDISAEEQRLAQQAIEARESRVLFRVENRAQQTDVGESVQTAQHPFEALPQSEAGRASASVAAAEGDQNNQQRKLDFLSQRSTGGIYNPHALQTPISPYQLMAGSVIAASLITGINSDLPGLVVAQVTENVHDTVTGNILLIPQGSRLIGVYDSVVAFGQKRALLVWQRILLPDGSSAEIDNLPASDTAGYAGLEDKVDFHTWQMIKGVALATLLGVGTEFSLGENESDLVKAIRESAQQNASRAGQRITEKNLNIQPTIVVRPGWPLRVIVHKDIVLRPYAS